jgi:predicted molibdopterin-dependent oxidoreductase YjgC
MSIDLLAGPLVTATVFITNTVQTGQLFIPMHYSAANQLTFPAVDPYSRQPAYKACAVSVKPCRDKSGVAGVQEAKHRDGKIKIQGLHRVQMVRIAITEYCTFQSASLLAWLRLLNS